MRYTQTGLFAILYFFVFYSATAQVQFGLRTENYSGVHAVRINPAASITYPLKWDVNLFEVTSHFANNYSFINNSSVFHTLNNIERIELRVESETPNPDALLVDYYFHNRPFYGITYNHVVGPSVLIATHPRFHWGISTAVRTMASVQNIDQEMGYDIIQDVSFYEPFTITPGKGAGMAWSEIGLHANHILTTMNGSLSYGAHLKLLQGWEAGFIENKTNFQVIRTPGDSLLYDQLQIHTGFTNSNSNPNNGFSAERNGGGLAIDLGVMYTIEEFEDEYRWRLGASVTDIGAVRFTKNTEDHLFTTNSSGVIMTNEYERVDNLDSLISRLSRDVLGNSNSSLTDNEFTIWLPTTLHLQADYAINSNIYFHTWLSLGIPLAKQQIRRGSLLSFGPRYESRWWAVNVPLSWYNWQDFRFGFSARLGFLTLGSDDLGSLIGQNKFDSSDFYISLKINPFNLGWGDDRKNIKCYDF